MAGDVWGDVYKFIRSISTQGQSDAQAEIARSGKEMAALMPQLAKEALEQAEGLALLARPEGSFATSDEILAAGEVGLRFFERFTPLYNKWTEGEVSIEEIRKSYDKFRGINFAAYRADLDRFGAAAPVLADSHGRMKQTFTGLILHWNGDASRAAGDHVDKFLRASDAVTDRTRWFSRIAAVNLTAMEKHVRSVARLTAELWDPGCGGHSPGSVDQMIKIVRGKSDSPFYNFLGKGMEMFGGTAKSVGGMIPHAGGAVAAGTELGAGLIAHFRTCLTDQFEKAFRNKHEAFVKNVTATEDSLNKMWTEFAGAAKEVPQDFFAGVSLMVPRPTGA